MKLLENYGKILLANIKIILNKKFKNKYYFICFCWKKLYS